ncbi:hypothetical protein [Pseudonocardia xishanensis]|uniref:Uncharacterized protein n=1 Tax=Pseudonocardia xishanensis TaxID=630995 RepID=A0ABP8S387_9PSEU
MSPGPNVRLVAAGAVLMVLLSVASLVAVGAGAPAAAFLPLAALALAVRPALVLHDRRRRRAPRPVVRARRVSSLH